MRLDRYLHEAGLGSRREVNVLVRRGRIVVGGELARDGAKHVPEGAPVTFDGAPVLLPVIRVIAFHKPAGLVTAARDRLPTIYDALPFRPDDLMPVGRLDRETEGLLLLTNDGQLLHRLTDPKRHVEKEYVACLARPLDGNALGRLRGPLDLGRDEVSRPALEAEALAPDVVRLVIDEGKYHQVRRMMEAVGAPVTRLLRTRVGCVRLDTLPARAHRVLEPEEERGLRAATGLLRP